MVAAASQTITLTCRHHWSALRMEVRNRREAIPQACACMSPANLQTSLVTKIETMRLKGATPVPSARQTGGIDKPENLAVAWRCAKKVCLPLRTAIALSDDG